MYAAAEQRREERANHHAVDQVIQPPAAPASNASMETYGDAEALAQAIGDLPPAQRDAIEMLKLREMSLKEAAGATGSSVGALKVATHRAMTALRRALVKDDAEHG